MCLGVGVGKIITRTIISNKEARSCSTLQLQQDYGGNVRCVGGSEDFNGSHLSTRLVANEETYHIDAE